MNSDFLFKILDSFLLMLIPAFILFGTKIISFPVRIIDNLSNQIGIIRIAKHRMEKDIDKKNFYFYFKEVKADIDEEEKLLFKV